MSNNLSAQMARYGVSESFHALIDGLRETPGLTDKKFRVEDVNKVAQYLVCRNYGKACLELSYLCWAVINYPSDKISHGPLLEFFWLNENISPKRFRQAFARPHQAIDSSIGISEDHLQLRLKDNKFAISPTRVGVLSVLLELIITNAPQQLALLQDTLAQAQDVSAIKAVSSELQKQIYQYLSVHLIQAQQQRRFRYITLWLDKHNHRQPYLNDRVVLEFWQQASVDHTSPGFKLYASALTDMIGVAQALQQAKHAQSLEHSSSIGFDLDAGEYSPDTIDQILFEQVSDQPDVSWLCQSPKFLTKAQWALLEPLYLHQGQIPLLSLSFVRLAVFGQWQSSLVQAKRKSSDLLRQKLNELPSQTYTEFYGQLVQHKKVMLEVVAAIIHIFYSHQDLRYLGLAIAQLPSAAADEIKRLMRQSLTRQTRLQGGSKNEVVFAQSKKIIEQSILFQQLMQSAVQAFKANNKTGFKLMPAVNELDEYQEGHDALCDCLKIIATLTKQLKKTWSNTTTSAEIYSVELDIFKHQFAEIYQDEADASQ